MQENKSGCCFLNSVQQASLLSHCITRILAIAAAAHTR